MSDTNQTSHASDEDTSGKTSDEESKTNSSDEQIDFKAEYQRLKAQTEDIVRSRNTEKSKRQALETRLQALEDAAKSQQNAKDEADGNIENLKKRFSSRETELLDQIAEKDRNLNRYIVREEIIKIAHEKAEDPELLCEILEARIKVSGFDERTGRPHFDVADEWRNIEDMIDNYLEQKPYLKKNTRKAGVGDDGGSERAKIKSTTQVVNSPDQGKSLFKGDPDAAREFLRSSKDALSRGR